MISKVKTESVPRYGARLEFTVPAVFKHSPIVDGLDIITPWALAKDKDISEEDTDPKIMESNRLF